MITGNLLEAFTISLDEENIVSRIPEGPRNGRGRHIYGRLRNRILSLFSVSDNAGSIDLNTC